MMMMFCWQTQLQAMLDVVENVSRWKIVQQQKEHSHDSGEEGSRSELEDC